MTTSRPEASAGSHSAVPRGFWGLVASQALGSFNDNAYQAALLFTVLRMGLSADQQGTLIALSGALFMLPFLLFSAHAGVVADRFSKRTVLIAFKVIEIAVMFTAAAALGSGSTAFLLAVLFAMETQSAFYSPAKYGILPQILRADRLSWGNGVLELTNFLGIILGTVAGSTLVWAFRGTPMVTGIVLAVVAVIGTAATFLVPRVEPANPGAKAGRAFRDLCGAVAGIARDRVLSQVLLGIAYFWAIGALLKLNVVDFGQKAFGGLSGPEQGILLASLGLGAGIGGVIAGKLSDWKVELGLVPLGSLLMAVFSASLMFTAGRLVPSCLLLAMTGVAAGCFIVPLNAMLQFRSPAESKGRAVAGANFVSFFAMLGSAGVYWVFTVKLKLAPAQIFLIGGVVTFLVGAWICRLLPEALIRFVLWAITHSFYRIRRIRPEIVPDSGGALLVCNHVSFVDGLLVLASLSRPVRFIAYKAIVEKPGLRYIAKALGVIPITTEEGPQVVLAALRAATQALKDGDLVCIFPEGEITRTGQLLGFRKGFERIVRDVDVPIIPLHLDRVWGSIFSFKDKRFVWKLPRRIPYRVTLTFGAPLPNTADAATLRGVISEMGTDAFSLREADSRSLPEEFIRTARAHPTRFSMVDTATRMRLTFRESLVRSVVLARALAPRWRDQEMVGICLPPTCVGALVNVAAALSGRVPVNINYTASKESIASVAEQCGIRTVLTSRAFLEKFPLDLPGEVLYIEDVVAAVTPAEKRTAWLGATVLPARRLMTFCGAARIPGPDDTATIIFSSGSTGDPKGVMLTNWNITSNIQALSQLFGPGGSDVILGILPFFHSFGFTGTLWLPLLIGSGAAYHANPLDARVIGWMAREYGATFLLATPSFLQAYTRRVEPGDFGSLRYVIAGAEKLTDRVADAFAERFGIEPYEGYGCTECSPIVAANVPDFRDRGFRQVGHKRGRIGHAIPGVTIRIVDTENGAPVPIGQPGLLLVKGPNVMKGYLGQPEKTSDVIRDGWYHTGDIAVMDEDGFVQITDRLSRFSKVAGEMVPHGKVEERLHEAAGATDRIFCVTGVPDASRGERLAVVHAFDSARVPELIAKLGADGLPNLWIPKASDFVRVEALPQLGTGKIDLRAVKEIAAKAAGAGA